MDEEQAKNYVDNQWQGNTKKKLKFGVLVVGV